MATQVAPDLADKARKARALERKKQARMMADKLVSRIEAKMDEGRALDKKVSDRERGSYSLQDEEEEILDTDDDGDIDEEDYEEILSDDDGDAEIEVEEEKPRSPLDNVADPSAVKIHEMIGHMLKALGFNPPDGMDETTFVRDIYETLMAKVQEMGAEHKALKDKPAEPENTEPEIDKGSNPVVQEMPSMYASLDEVKKIKDPKERKFAEAMFSLHQENARNKRIAENASASIIGQARAIRDRRVEKLGRRLPHSKRDDLLKMVAAPSAALSLGDDGCVVDPLSTMLGIMESTTPDMGIDLSAAKEQPHPSDGPYSPERHEAAMQEVLKSGGSGRAA